jgi:hypothetical protein
MVIHVDSKSGAVRVKPKLATLDDGSQIFVSGNPRPDNECKGRKPAALIPLGSTGRQITSTGRWNDGLLLGYMVQAEIEYQARVLVAANAEAARERFHRGWITVGELARVAYGQNSLETKAKTRTRLTTLFHFALLEGVVINLDYDFGTGGHGRVVAAKVFDKTDAEEVRKLDMRLTKLLARRELSEELYFMARDLSGISPEADAIQ